MTWCERSVTKSVKDRPRIAFGTANAARICTVLPKCTRIPRCNQQCGPSSPNNLNQHSISASSGFKNLAARRHTVCRGSASQSTNQLKECRRLALDIIVGPPSFSYPSAAASARSCCQNHSAPPAHHCCSHLSHSALPAAPLPAALPAVAAAAAAAAARPARPT